MTKFKKTMRTFFTDEDGMNPRDFLLLLASFIVLSFFLLCIGFLLFQKDIPTDLFVVMDRLDTVLMTVITGTMGVQAVESISKSIASRKETPVDTPSEPQKDKVEDDII